MLVMDHLDTTELQRKLVQTAVNTTVAWLATASPPDEQTAPATTSQTHNSSSPTGP